jgi:hypothetical protein
MGRDSARDVADVSSALVSLKTMVVGGEIVMGSPQQSTQTQLQRFIFRKSNFNLWTSNLTTRSLMAVLMLTSTLGMREVSSFIAS